MSANFQVNLGPLMQAIDRHSVAMRRSYADSFRRGMTGMVRRAVAITPPASAAAARLNAGGTASRPQLTKADQERGKTKVEATVNRLFYAIGRSRTRAERASSLAEIERIHSRLFRATPMGGDVELDQPDRYLTTEDAVQGLLKRLFRKVGTLASGWRAGARKFSTRLPAWVEKNDGQGAASLETRAGQWIATVTNMAAKPGLEKVVRGRLRWAQMAQVKAMEREISHQHKTRAQQDFR